MSNPGANSVSNPGLTGMHKILNGGTLDQRVTIYVGTRGFEGTIGETEHQDILVLMTKGAIAMDILIASIDAVKWHRD